ncbi:MAG: hypothetical protein UHW86_05835 [Spirochaetota bacterium]|jgi:hypothetical protein|nr:hypothetical protein [Spirochaetota bacterium]
MSCSEEMSIAFLYSFYTSLHNSFEKLFKKGMMPATMIEMVT